MINDFKSSEMLKHLLSQRQLPQAGAAKKNKYQKEGYTSEFEYARKRERERGGERGR